ncbi:MAG: phage antirepressor N-terminal domain-containing protein [Lachnospiraceae bacterium]|nr:phage antirepressor N-terminal domain-containing protein [Lachnospiraceae bacterium]
MENKLEVKTVDFMGDGLLAVKDNDGVVWAGVKWLCDGIGLSEGQTKGERKKIQEDVVLSKGTKFYPLGKDNANSDVLCLQLDYVPLWLAKISITPNMKENSPELVEKLIKYQLKAKDVLAAAFLPQAKPSARKTKRIGKSKTTVALYSGEDFYILRIGEDFYNLDVDEFTELDSLIPMLLSKDIGQVPEIIRIYLSLHEENSPKLAQEWTCECDE